MAEKIVIRAEVFRENDQFVSVCSELNVSSFGDTPEEAKKSLIEAVSLFLEECQRMGSLDEVLKEAGFSHLAGEKWVSPEPVIIEKLSLQLAGMR